MGCTVSRSSVSAEKYLRERETACSLARARARNADLTIRRYAQEWILTPDQLSKATSLLGVSVENDIVARYHRFFHSFRKEGLYQALYLLVALVLLGQGSKEEKLELIFEAFDEKCANVIFIRTVHSMASMLLKVAILKAPLLALAPNIETRTKLQWYLHQLKAGLPFATSALTNLLLAGKPSLSLKDFLANSQSTDITNCGELRDFAIRVSPKQQS